jgi:hypothetical protein
MSDYRGYASPTCSESEDETSKDWGSVYYLLGYDAATTGFKPGNQCPADCFRAFWEHGYSDGTHDKAHTAAR